MGITVYNGECEEILEEMIKKKIKVNSVITDPPYGTTLCAWDKVIDFERMWGLLKEVAPNAPIVLFGKQPFTSRLIMSNPGEFRENVAWLKNKAGNGFGANQRHIQVLEDIIVFSESGSYTFNPQKWLVAEKEFLTQRKTFDEVEVGNNVYGKIKRVRKADTGERNPINIVTARVPFTPSKSREYKDDVDLRYHPTQKPLELMQYLVRTYSDKGGTVLDFTAGSFTTGVACVREGRSFIGIEKNMKYCEVGKARLEKVADEVITIIKKGSGKDGEDNRVEQVPRKEKYKASKGVG